jgi:hypothetical protein
VSSLVGFGGLTPAVAVQVSDRDAEPRDVLRQSGAGRDILKCQLAEIAEQPRAGGGRAVVALDGVLTDDEIQQAVSVEIERRGAPSAKGRRAGAVVL